MGEPRRILIGKITGAHGVKGEVKVLSKAADAGLLFRKSGVYTSETGNDIVKLVSRVEQKPGLFISKVNDVTDRNVAERLGGTPLYIDRDDLPETDDVYLSDLEGLPVVTPEGKALGTVTAVQNFGAGDLIDVLGPDGKSFYLPLAEPFLVEIDMDAGKIVMNEIEVMP